MRRRGDDNGSLFEELEGAGFGKLVLPPRRLATTLRAIDGDRI